MNDRLVAIEQELARMKNPEEEVKWSNTSTCPALLFVHVVVTLLNLNEDENITSLPA